VFSCLRKLFRRGEPDQSRHHDQIEALVREHDEVMGKAKSLFPAAFQAAKRLRVEQPFDPVKGPFRRASDRGRNG
jgi:hypothetical protein